LDYYNFCVIGNFVFEYEKPLISDSCEYEENGVLYCATGTEQGVYCYSYARNCPLMYTDPDGEFLWCLVPVAMWLGGMINLYMNRDNINTLGQGLAYWGIGAIAGGAGAISGGAAFAAVGVSGFLGGMVAGAVGGFTGGFITGSANTWMQGGSFGQGMLNGLIGGAVGGAIGGITGGLFGAIQADWYGTNPWNGSFEHRYTLPSNPFDSYAQSLKAPDYNGSFSASCNDALLETYMSTHLNFEQGDLGFPFSTEIPNNDWGLTSQGGYITPKNEVYGGLVKGNWGNPKTYSMHISPYALRSVVDFKAIAGHEIIHAYHINVFGSNFIRGYSEGAAYRYSYQIYSEAGSYRAALSYLLNPNNNGFSYPPSYRIPYGLKWPFYW
ncbi:MAG: hypothetical protein LBU83_08530, partial [Bacteroidales bacterium]|nr:hypothetical protein [Bacteroidales bacterium]